MMEVQAEAVTIRVSSEKRGKFQDSEWASREEREMRGRLSEMKEKKLKIRKKLIFM